MKHHEDETGHQGVVGGGKEGGVLLSFHNFSADRDCMQEGRREGERVREKGSEQRN